MENARKWVGLTKLVVDCTYYKHVQVSLQNFSLDCTNAMPNISCKILY